MTGNAKEQVAVGVVSSVSAVLGAGILVVTAFGANGAGAMALGMAAGLSWLAAGFFYFLGLTNLQSQRNAEVLHSDAGPSSPAMGSDRADIDFARGTFRPKYGHLPSKTASSGQDCPSKKLTV